MHKMAFAHVFGPEKKTGFGPFSYKFFVCIRVGLMGTKNLNENGPNPFFLFGTKNLVRPTLMGTKHLYENGPNRQVWVRSDFSLIV